MSASWPMAGEDLRKRSGESAEFPTGVEEVVTLLGKSRRSISNAMGGEFHQRNVLDLWLSNVVCKTTVPRVFELTNRVSRGEVCAHRFAHEGSTTRSARRDKREEAEIDALPMSEVKSPLIVEVSFPCAFLQPIASECFRWFPYCPLPHGTSCHATQSPLCQGIGGLRAKAQRHGHRPVVKANNMPGNLHPAPWLPLAHRA
jgi:hypothetical protein